MIDQELQSYTELIQSHVDCVCEQYSVSKDSILVTAQGGKRRLILQRGLSPQEVKSQVLDWLKHIK